MINRCGTGMGHVQAFLTGLIDRNQRFDSPGGLARHLVDMLAGNAMRHPMRKRCMLGYQQQQRKQHV